MAGVRPLPLITYFLQKMSGSVYLTQSRNFLYRGNVSQIVDSLKAYSMLDFQNYKKNWLKQMEIMVLIPVFQDMFRINRCKLQIIPNRESVLEDFKKIIHFNQLIGPVRITYNIC